MNSHSHGFTIIKMKFAHISDIHWRGLTRHDEYKRAFSRAFAELKTLQPDVIVITGDIVHSKTQGISPELIDHLTWWFNAMIDICDVHVILGNHDGNLMNAQRQDAISPIINAINDSRIHLYKQSGVYKCAPGFNFCVYSIFDEQGWTNVAPVKGDVNIALYHGAVVGSTTDAGWALDGEIDVTFFKQYDFVFLGDIHKHQALETRNGKPWIAYPGSTIMQDYGETPGKGYLLWDIQSRDSFNVEFKLVEHDREFRTIEWAGTLQDTLKIAKKLPRGTRVRIKSSSLIPQTEVRQLTTELVTMHGASEVVFKDEYISSAAAPVDKEVAEKQDLRDPDVIVDLFKKFYGDSDFKSEQIESVKELIVKYLARIVQEDSTPRNTRWHLKELSFDNLFGYGEDNYIDFRRLNGITGIFGPNRIGKSSIIGSLLYTLYNGSDRGSIKNLHLINSRKNYCRSKLTFDVDGKNYGVERQSVRHENRAGVQHAVTHLNLYESDDEGKPTLDLNGEQRTDTERSLRLLVGSSEDVMMTGIAAQGDMNRFIEAGSSYRDQVMSRFLDLLIFEKMAQYAKEDSSGIRAQMKNAPDRDWTALIVSKKDELQRHASEIVRTEAILKEKRSQLEALRIQLATSNASNIITQADVDRSKENVDELRETIEKSKPKLEKAVFKSTELTEKLTEVQARIAEIPVDELQKQKAAIYALKDRISELRQSYEKEKQILFSQEKSVKRLNDVPCGDLFPTCKYISDSHADKQKIEKQKTLVECLLSDVSNVEADAALINVDLIESELSRYTSLLKLESSRNLELVKLNQVIADSRREILRLENKLMNAEVELADFLSRVVEDDDSVELKRNINDLQKQIDQLDSLRVKAASRKGSLQTEIVQLVEEKAKFTKLKADWYLFEIFIQAMSKRGIPAQIIQTQLPLINSEISRILQGVVDYTLRFEKDEESNSTEIYIDYGDSKRLIELGSGMEKMISSLAIRVALQNASSLPRPDFLILDEGFGTLDESNIEACNRLLVSLKRWFRNIIVISHIDGVKDVTDNIVEITRIDKDSCVKMT